MDNVLDDFDWVRVGNEWKRVPAIPSDDLNSAWTEVEMSLPEGWAVNMLWGTTTEVRWAAAAGPFPSKPGDPQIVEGGDTPAGALFALASALRQRT